MEAALAGDGPVLSLFEPTMIVVNHPVKAEIDSVEVVFFRDGIIVRDAQGDEADCP